MTRNVEVENAPAVMADDEEAVRNPARCQRARVSGVTTMRERFHAGQKRRASTQKSLSRKLSLGLARLRLNTINCCRSARFSRSSPRWERKQWGSKPSHSRRERNMSEFIANGRVEETVQTVDFTEGHNFGEAQAS